MAEVDAGLVLLVVGIVFVVCIIAMVDAILKRNSGI